MSKQEHPHDPQQPAEPQRQSDDPPEPPKRAARDELAETWSRYLQALDDWRHHRTQRADEVQRRLDEALALGRRLAERARKLRSPGNKG